MTRRERVLLLAFFAVVLTLVARNEPVAAAPSHHKNSTTAPSAMALPVTRWRIETTACTCHFQMVMCGDSGRGDVGRPAMGPPVGGNAMAAF